MSKPAPTSDMMNSLQLALGTAYELQRELVGGGMARIFVAEEKALRRLVVVKVLPPALAAELRVERFRHEIQLAAQLHHPHIVPVLAAGESGGILYYTMPYVEGESVRTLITSEKQLRVERAARLAREIAGALDYAHARGVVHRDIKPENILLAGDHAVITDFGIARALSRALDSDSLTGTGLAIGTPAYMSPEQASGEREIDGRSDIYSLGCVLYEMLAGEPPFTGATQQAVIAKRFATTAPSIRIVRQEIPESLDRAISRALAKAPADRFSSARDFADALAITDTLPTRRASRRVVAYAAAGLLALVAAGFAMFAGNRGAAAPFRSGGSATLDRARAIAVLPFANLSADPADEFFADGMTEELINSLSGVRGLRVAARTSVFALRGRQLDVRTVGDTLNVAIVLEGSVRRTGDSVRVTARLVNAADGYQLWVNDYYREVRDVFQVQNEIAGSIVAALRPRFDLSLDGAGRARMETRDQQAYEEYLKGRFYMNTQGVRGWVRAREHFLQAVARDPRFARAHAGLSATNASIGALGLESPSAAMPRAKASALRALELDSTLAEAHAALGHVLMVWEWDAAGAEAAFRLSIALDSGGAHARWLYGVLLLSQRRFDEASTAFHLARDLEPLLPHTNSLLGRYYVAVNRPDDAIRYLLDALRLGPNLDLAYQQLGHAYLQKKMTREALDAFRRAAALSGARDSAHLAYAYAVSGNGTTALEILDDLQRASARRYQPPVDMAIGYAGVGMPDRAFEWLERGYAERASFMEALDVLPGLERLRGDPRFTQLLRKVGMAAARGTRME